VRAGSGFVESARWLFHLPLPREALWIGFSGASWKPNAVKIGVGNINAVSGKPWDQELHDDPQDYLVCPQQPWLDGINAGDGYIRQFIAMPLGSGYTVEGQLTGADEFGGIQILVFEPKPGFSRRTAAQGRDRPHGHVFARERPPA